MDYYVDSVLADNLKLVPREHYDGIIDTLVKYPIKQVKIMQPGPWGGQRHRALWEVPGLECNAWNELAGIELSVLIDVGARETLNIPAQNFMQHPHGDCRRIHSPHLPGSHAAAGLAGRRVFSHARSV